MAGAKLLLSNIFEKYFESIGVVFHIILFSAIKISKQFYKQNSSIVFP